MTGLVSLGPKLGSLISTKIALDNVCLPGYDVYQPVQVKEMAGLQT